MEKPEGTAERVGGYRVVRRLATGGTSDVLLAKAEGPHGFERTVVLKVLLSQYRNDDEFAQMFAREASAYARLAHPSIVRLFDFFQLDGQLVMVLEYVDGPPLSRLRGMIRAVDGQLDDRASIHVAGRVFDALAAAHSVTDEKGEAAPVIHRDVNPSNVLVAWGGHVKLADFGIAKVTGSKHESRLGIIKGTYGYMAPEQVKGELVSSRADIYAGGVILWELLTRRRAFQRGALPEVEVLRQMAEPKITSLDVLRPDVDRNVREAVRRALEPDPGKRTISADEMVGILRNAVATDLGREHLQKALATVRHEPKPLPSIPPPAPSASAGTPRGALPRVAGPARTPSPNQTAPLGSFKSEPPTRRSAPSLGDIVDKALAKPRMPSQPTLPGAPSTEPPTPTPPVEVPQYERRKSIPDRELDSMPGRSVRDAINEILDSVPSSLPPGVLMKSDAPMRRATATGPDEPLSDTVAMAAPVVGPYPHEGGAHPSGAQGNTAPMLAYTTKAVIGLEAASAAPSQDQPQRVPYGPPPTPQQPNAPMPALNPLAQPPTPFVPQTPAVARQAYGPPPNPPYAQPVQNARASMPPPMQRPAPPTPPPQRPHPSSLSGQYAPMDTGATPPRKSRSALALIGVVFATLAVGVGGVAWYMRTHASVRPSIVATQPSASAALPSTAIVIPPSASAVAPASASAVPSASASASAVPSASAAAPGAGTGLVKTEGSVAGRRVFIDDKVVGQTPESFTVKCGVHQLKVGSSGHAHSIDVPCGGEVTATQ